MSNTLEEALQTAILREAAAYELYTSAARMVAPGPTQDMLFDLAAQERGHRRRLEGILAKGSLAQLTAAQQERVLDLRLTDHLVSAPLGPNAGLQDILIVAGKREAASHAFYTDMATVAEDAQLRTLFETLANEELKHKQAIEKLYEEMFYPEN
ncbi:MAG: ferritin family protein [Anaerolineales bacterium]